MDRLEYKHRKSSQIMDNVEKEKLKVFCFVLFIY